MGSLVGKIGNTSIIMHGNPKSFRAKTYLQVVVPSKPVPRIMRMALLLFIFSIFFEYAFISLGFRGISPPKITGILLFGLSVVYWKVCFANPPSALFWFFGYIAIFFLHGLYLPPDYMSAFFRRLFTMTQLILVFYIFSNLLRDEEIMKSVLFTFLIGAGILAIGSILNLPGFGVIEEEHKTGARIGAAGMNVNYLSILMGYALIIAFGLWKNLKKGNRTHRVFLIGLSVPILTMLLLASSRGALVATICGIGIFAMPFGEKKQKMKRMFYAILGLIVILFLSTVWGNVGTRFQKTIDEGKTAGRDKIWSGAVDMISEKPFFGWQPILAFAEVHKREAQNRGIPQWLTGRDTHNIILWLLVEVGIVGTIPFLIGFGLCVQAAWKTRVSCLGLLPLALLGAMVIFNQAHTELNKKVTWVFLGLSIASVQRTQRIPISSKLKIHGAGGIHRRIPVCHGA